ncbi:hypothetical protein ACIGW1_37330, partial [Streptomyces sp. NPDC053780]|uniref:hypothetical protein n=1 Tax=unclassified Streptomyces TaxID=2593676 RepID=UPI00342F943A
MTSSEPASSYLYLAGLAPARGLPRRVGMVPLSLGEIAGIVGGTVVGDSCVAVTAPAVLDSR